jgi:hypothetical protein
MVLGNQNSEDIYSPEFRQRTREKNPNCTEIRHEWAEIKTSILLQELSSNPTISKNLSVFMQRLASNYITFVKQDPNSLLNIFFDELKTSKPGDNVQTYPVAQTPQWLMQGGAAKISSDFYSLIEFSKWVYTSIHQKQLPKYITNNQDVQNMKHLTNLLQQRFFMYIQTLRGDRLDELGSKKDPKYGGQKMSDQIGIGKFYLEYLKRKVRDGYKPVPWLHPGKKCRLPYRGKYGYLLKEYNMKNDFFGSVQCGISASTQYILFMYLMIISTQTLQKTNFDEDFRDLVTIICFQLVGDGGHNIREVLTGITSTIILFNALIIQLEKELSDNIFMFEPDNKDFIRVDYVTKNPLTTPILSKILKNVNSLVKDTKEIYYLYNYVIKNIFTLKDVIQHFYKLTMDMNIVGITKEDLQIYFKVTNLTNTKITIEKATINLKILKGLFDKDILRDETMYTEKILNDIQLFFALDNDRYLLPLNSFTKSADNKITQIVKMYGTEGESTLNAVNKILDNELDNGQCHVGGPAISERGNSIPFAFEKSKKHSSRKKSRERKASKKHSRRKKSLERKASKKHSRSKKSRERKASKKHSRRNKSKERKSSKKHSRRKKSVENKASKKHSRRRRSVNL